jgi:hypothetical protein
MVFWMHKRFWLSQACVAINTFAQLYAVLYLLSPTSDYAMENSNTLTHLVAKTFAGIGVLDFFDNGAVALVIFPSNCQAEEVPLIRLPCLEICQSTIKCICHYFRIIVSRSCKHR